MSSTFTHLFFSLTTFSFLLTMSHRLDKSMTVSSFFFLKNKKNKKTFIVDLRKTVDCCAQHIRTKIKGTNFSILTLHSLPPEMMKQVYIHLHLSVNRSVRYMRVEMRVGSGDSVPSKRKRITLQNNMHIKQNFTGASCSRL